MNFAKNADASWMSTMDGYVRIAWKNGQKKMGCIYENIRLDNRRPQVPNMRRFLSKKCIGYVIWL